MKIILIIISLVLIVTDDKFDQFVRNYIGNGTMGGFITHKEFKNIIKNLTQYDFVEVEEIGKTYNNNSIDLIKIETNKTNKAVLFTGLHHAREPVSSLMNIYVLLYIINKVSENDLAVKELLNNVNIYFIPMINVDGYIKNNELFETYRNFDMCLIRKNRRNNCDDQSNSGVDLNRNYNFKFNNDEQGSSGNKCQEDFRGEYPFSENETRAVKDFIDKHDNIKIAFNYHSWGNLLIIPFNYLDMNNELLSNNYTNEYYIYQEFLNEAGFPTGFKFGNGMKAIGYKANGEASDWMLGEKNILAFSPELGTNESESDKFYPNIDLVLNNILKENLKSALYGIQKASYIIKLNSLKNSFSDCKLITSMGHKLWDKKDEELQEERLCKQNNYQFTSNINIKNTGLSEFNSKLNILIKINTKLVEAVTFRVKEGNKVKIDEEKQFQTLSFEAYEHFYISIDSINNYTGDSINFRLYVNKDKVNEISKYDTLFKIIVNEDFTNNELIFAYPKFIQKLVDFSLFTIDTPSSQNISNESKAKYKIVLYIIVGVLLLLIILLIITLRKIRSAINEENDNDVINRIPIPQSEMSTLRTASRDIF